MKSPHDIRPGIWRNGVMQIWITRTCDKKCFGCTQGSNLGGKPAMMKVEQFAKACDSLKGYFGVIGVFGGNPCTHPDFDEICFELRQRFPKEQCGLWSNNLMGKARAARITFNPAVSNLNVHLDTNAWAEFRRDWPEARVFGVDQDSRHSPPYVAMQDVIEDEGERWRLISACDINQYWSAMICVFRGELRAYFCELAGAQAMLHAHEPDYPDLGHCVVPGWWDKPMSAYADQVRYHCHACGIPLRGYGALAVNGDKEQVSKTHVNIYKPKDRQRMVEIVTSVDQLRDGVKYVTSYYANGVAEPCQR